MTRHRTKWLPLLAALMLVIPALSIHGSYAQGTSRTFTETGKTVKGKFLDYWNSHGGLAQQGFPISEEMQDTSPTDGKVYTMQYFERAVFEMHPENAAPNDVLLSLLGNFQYKEKYGSAGAPGQKASTEAGAQKFSQTGKTAGGKFLAYWQKNGGLAQQGYPVSDEFTEKSDLNGKTYTVQYFERAVFELHPENQAPYDVLLSQLGTFQLKKLQTAVAYPEGSGSVTLWHGYTGGGSEAATLTKMIKQLTDKNPNFKVTVLQVPFDQLQNKFTTEAATGGGPDLVIGPSDWIGAFADANLISSLDGMAGVPAVTANLLPSAVNVAKYNGKLYGFPVNMKNVALYYNKSIVKTLPKDTDAMLTDSAKLVGGTVKYGLAFNTGFYNAVGYNYAFGGKLFTDPKHVDLTQQGTIDWLNWMKKAKSSPGVLATGKGDDIDNGFKTGQIGMLINGPWALEDYQKALGADKVGVAVAPGTPKGGKFAPFVGTENYFLNDSSANKPAAVAFVKYIASAGVQKVFVTDAGHITTNTRVDLSSNPLLQFFVAQAAQGTPFPNFPAMGKVWDPAGNMISEVVDKGTDAATAAKKANDDINKAIEAGQ